MISKDTNNKELTEQDIGTLNYDYIIFQQQSKDIISEKDIKISKNMLLMK